MGAKIIRELRRLPLLAYILVVPTVLGLSVGAYRLYAGLGQTTHLSKVFPWGVWISFDLTTVALSGGAFTLAALVYIFHMHDLHPATRPTVLFGLLGYSAVLVILFFDLGRWDRFWHFLVYPNINSALFEVSWCIALYSTVLIFEFSPVVLEGKGFEKLLAVIKKLTIPMVIAGVTLSSMHQSSLGALFVIMSPRLHPLWYSMLLPAFFLFSSVAAGITLVISGSILSKWLFGQTLSQKVIEKLGWFLPWILGFYLALKLGELLVAEEVGLLFSSGKYSVLFLAELIIGAVIPIFLFSIKKIRMSSEGSLVSSLFVIAGIILNRFNTSWFAIEPINGVQYSPSWMEIAILIGVLSGVFLVFTLLAHYFPVFEETISVEKPVLKKGFLTYGEKVSNAAGD
ncbi:MAG TPA: polysulfide reductase NrfD [Anaerolineae bacterium]|nr:polysulfide reductase NrfD [Anaerolineae bacterium]